MENKIITRDKPTILQEETTNKKPWNPPTVKEFKIEKNTNSAPGPGGDGVVGS